MSEDEDQEPMVVSEIIIRRAMDADGADLIQVDLPYDSSLVEILGMLDFARQTAWQVRQCDPEYDDED